MIAPLTLTLAALAAGSPTPASPDSGAAIADRVEIVRTEFGIPHILADDLKAMGFALGYVQSEDYGPSIATAMVQSRGHYARVVGPDALDDDFQAREAYALAVEGWPRLHEDTREVYEGFARGVNHYIRLHPEEFPDWIRPHFRGVDALARDVQTWSRGDAASFVRSLETPDPERGPAEPEESDASFALDGSNAWALHGSRTASGNTFLLRNPHLRWRTEDPLLEEVSGSTYYEAHVRVPGVLEFYGDFRIGTAFGIIGGFNARLGWATTNNYPTYSQVYALALHPDLPHHVMLDDAPLALEERRTSVDYRVEGGEVAEEGLELAVEERSTWWTPFGPVIHRDDRFAYVLKDPRHGEVRSGEQFLRMMQARDLEEWLGIMRMRAHPSSNFTYADADGNIAHYYNARIPDLPHEATGDTAAVARHASDMWSRLVPWDLLPLYVNPPGGYVQQANDTPDFTNLNVPLDRDTVAANLPEPRLRLRSQLSLEMIHGDQALTLEDVVALKHTPRMPMAERMVDDLVEIAGAAGDPALDEAARVLSRWDRAAAVDSRGAVLFQHWADAYWAGPDTLGLWREEWAMDRPTETPRGIGNSQRALESLASSLSEMERRGLPLDVSWGDVHRMVRGGVDVPISGCPSTLGCFRALSFMEMEDGRYAANRGDAWVLLVEFGETPRAYSVLAYGQTAREGSPHFDDQAALFAQGRLKPVAWTDETIAASALERYHPGEEGPRD